MGHKTAAVVMSQAFGVPAFPVDTHIHRLMHRWNFTNGKSVEQTERDAKRLFPEDRWNKLHLQIIFYGREYSPARGWSLEKDYISARIGRKSLWKNAADSREQVTPSTPRRWGGMTVASLVLDRHCAKWSGKSGDMTSGGLHDLAKLGRMRRGQHDPRHVGIPVFHQAPRSPRPCGDTSRSRFGPTPLS